MTYRYSEKITRDGVTVEYQGHLKSEHVSLSDISGISTVSCSDDSEIIVDFESDSEVTSALDLFVHDVTLLSGICGGKPVYAKIISTKISGTRRLQVEVEHVQLQDLFHNLKVEGRMGATKPRRQLRSVNWVEGDLSDVSSTEQNRYTVSSQPYEVQKQWNDRGENEFASQVSNQNIDLNYPLLENVGFNYDASTKSAIVNELTDESGSLVCENCYANVNSVNVFFEMAFGIGPESFRAGVEGSLVSNLKFKVQNPAVTSNTVEIMPDTQIAEFNFAIGPVPIQLVLRSSMTLETKLQRPIAVGEFAATGGIKMDASMKAGVQWTNSNGWNAINQFDKNVDTYPMALVVTGLENANKISAKLIPTFTLSLWNRVPIFVKPSPTMGFDFGGNTNACSNKDGYDLFTSLELGLGVGDIKFTPDGPTIIGGFSSEFDILSKQSVASSSLFGQVCGDATPNFCTGCLSDIKFDKDALIELFKSVCQNWQDGCDGVETAAAAYGLSAAEINEIKQSDDISVVLIAGVCAGAVVVLVGVVMGVIAFRRSGRSSTSPSKKKKKRGKKKKNVDVYITTEQV